MNEDEIREKIFNLLVDFRNDVVDKAQERIVLGVDKYINDFVDLYKQEKEKNKELEDVIELMAEQLAPLETPTGGVAWTSIGVKDVFFEIAKTRKRILEEE